MKSIHYLLIALVFISSCKEDTEEQPNLPNDYGSGLYIATDNGVSFYDGETVKNQIYRKVNGTILSNVERIKFKGTKAYILADHNLFTVNIETFEDKGTAGSFVNAVDFEFVIPEDRMFVVDKGDSKVKVVDLDRMEITSDIETGDRTKPVFIVAKWYRSVIMNGGAVADSLKDSTIVAIDYRDELVPLADMMGSLYIGDNPNSAVMLSDLKVLCKGIYDENDLPNKTESSLIIINPWENPMQFNSTSQTLGGIYNANNLTSTPDESKYYFTAEGGVYSMNNNGSGVTNIINIVSDILYYQDEQLYINDSENSKNTIYKYNVGSNIFLDTIVVDGNARDINFY